MYQFIYFWASVVLSRKKALDAVNVAKNQTYRGEEEINLGLEFLGILAMNVSWNLGKNIKSSLQLCFSSFSLFEIEDDSKIRVQMI